MSQAYGIVYHAQEGSKSPVTVADVQRLSTSGTVKYVRVAWSDLTNTVRIRVLSVTYFLKLLTASSRPGVCLTHVSLGGIGDHINEYASTTGEWLYVFDLSSFRLCPYAPGHAMVFGFFQEKLLTPSQNPAINICPRGILQRILE